MTRRPAATHPFCNDCLADTRINCPRDPDAKCLICRLELCAAHIGPHLAKMHCCALTLDHCSQTAPENAKDPT